MRSLSGLQFNRSIEKRKLVFAQGWLDKIDRFVVYIFCLWGATLPFLVYFDPYRDKTRTGGEYYLLFIATALGLYVLYRKATEKKLNVITTPYDSEKTKQLLNAYLVKEGFNKYRNSNNIIIFNEPTSDFNPTYMKSRIFLLKGNRIYFTIIRDHFRFNIPVLTSHYFLKRDLKNIFRPRESPE